MMRCLKVVLNCCDSIDTESPFVFVLFIFVLFCFGFFRFLKTNMVTSLVFIHAISEQYLNTLSSSFILIHVFAFSL